MVYSRIPLVVLLAGAFAGASAASAQDALPAAGSEAHFERVVRPLLESSCTHCHGGDKPDGGLDLTTLEAALKGGDSGTALVPGKPEDSPLYTTTVLPPDHDDIMPPEKEPPLTRAQTGQLREWIAAGAPWPQGVVLGSVPRMQFVRDIQPILEVNCVTCHNPDKADGELDLTTLESALKGGDSGPAVVPYDPDSSPLVTLTELPADHDDLMPPENKGGPLPAEEIRKLRLWVSQGAPWQEGVVLVKRTKAEERPPSPDSLELVARIRERILASGQEEDPASMKGYTGTIPKTGKTYDMVPIPGGEFLMGSPESEAGRSPDEGPQVRVKIEPFWMGATEVTWEMYMPFMVTPDARWKDGSLKNPPAPDAPPVDVVSSPTAPYTDMTFGMGQDGYPAISMTEHAASKFCQWLSAQTGHFYRLPTEAEWEYAARAGTTTAWFFGDDPDQLGEYAWYYDNSDEKTQPVRRKKPSPWGLYDIYGNVVEWTLDQYDPEAYARFKEQGEPVLNPFNRPVTLYPRVVRGGSWDDDPERLRSAARRGSQEAWKADDPNLPRSIWYHTNARFLGFRIVRPLKVPSAEEMHYYWNIGVVK